jgi:hypothetical protein
VYLLVSSCFRPATLTLVPVGVQSELPFLNSMKMKMSILLGVVHMNLGIMMSLFNNLYFKDRLSTICEFVPQVSQAGGVPLTPPTKMKQLGCLHDTGIQIRIVFFMSVCWAAAMMGFCQRGRCAQVCCS